MRKQKRQTEYSSLGNFKGKDNERGGDAMVTEELLSTAEIIDRRKIRNGSAPE